MSPTATFIAGYDRSDVEEIGVEFTDGEIERISFTNMGGGYLEDLEDRIDNLYSWDHFNGLVARVYAYDAGGDVLATIEADAYFGKNKEAFEQGRREGF